MILPSEPPLDWTDGLGGFEMYVCFSSRFHGGLVSDSSVAFWPLSISLPGCFFLW